jgi:hypothetical protein
MRDWTCAFLEYLLGEGHIPNSEIGSERPQISLIITLPPDLVLASSRRLAVDARQHRDHNKQVTVWGQRASAACEGVSYTRVNANNK